MTIVRRFLVLLAVLFWQGGFMFYSAVVVPVGSEVLGSHRQQGFVTRSVTTYLNLAGLASILVLGWDIASASDPAQRRRWLRWGLWALLVVTLGLLVWLHTRLDGLLDVETFQILNRGEFRALHSWYLNISTLQWAASLILAGVTLWAWRAQDRGAVPSSLAVKPTE